MKKHRGGRPVTNPRLHQLMREHKCSRTWAYKLLERERQEHEQKVLAEASTLVPVTKVPFT